MVDAGKRRSTICCVVSILFVEYHLRPDPISTSLVFTQQILDMEGTCLEVLVGEVPLRGEAELVEESLHRLGQNVLHRCLIVNILEEHSLAV